SAEVEGERVKPVGGADGSRVPLLRVGFTPSGPYTVSFVYLNTGAKFAKAGAYEMTLPKLDVPVNFLTWEVSLPERLQVKQFAGNALAAELLPAAAQDVLASNFEEYKDADASSWTQNEIDFARMGAGQIGGIVTDPNGAVIPNATITVLNRQTGASQTTQTDGEGHWLISGAQPGATAVSINAPGFKQLNQELALDNSHPARLGSTLDVGTVSETVTVQSGNITLDGIDRVDQQARKRQATLLNAPSQNVVNFARRVAGILPVRVDVPRSGRSYRFVRPLVMDEETTISFQYKMTK
ncbi:MAG TPA: carboxypeptidase-like regulatory domain-containing protein, partial [Pyrinomonadaceae bacterium]|nr:carboxypeptidase-like regulatory domain-containing protein [Pyrinomonadaceae bacterium]